MTNKTGVRRTESIGNRQQPSHVGVRREGGGVGGPRRGVGWRYLVVVRATYIKISGTSHALGNAFRAGHGWWMSSITMHSSSLGTASATCSAIKLCVSVSKLQPRNCFERLGNGVRRACGITKVVFSDDLVFLAEFMEMTLPICGH